MKHARLRLAGAIAITLMMASTVLVGAEKVTLTYGHASTAAHAEWAQEVVASFRDVHPDIDVQLVACGTGNAYQEKYILLSAAGDAPDIFMGYADKLGFIIKGFALDITPYAQRDMAQLQIDTFFPGVWEAPVYQGRRYGVPLAVTTQFMYFNKDLFLNQGLALPPAGWDDREWTWDRFLASAKRLTVVDSEGRYQQLALTQASEAKLPDVVQMFGGDWFEEQAYKTGWADRVTMTRPENIRAYQAVRDVYADYAAAGPAKGIAALNGFLQGKIAMDWIGSWRMSNSFVPARKTGGMPFQLTMGPPPLVLNRANTRWTFPFYISAASKHPQEAWEFVKFATGTNNQKLWSVKTAQMPARRTATDVYVASLRNVFDMSANEILAAISGSADHSVLSIEESVAEVPFEISRKASQWIDPMLAGQVPIENALITMETALNVFIAEINQKRERR